MPKPGQVMGVRVTPGVGQLMVSWDMSPGAEDYTVQWKSGSQDWDGSASPSRQATGETGTSYTIPTLSADTEYTVRVRARNGASGNTDKSDGGFGPWSTQKMGRPKPAHVTFGAEDGVTSGVGKLTVKWTMVTGATGYKVQWRSGGRWDSAPQAIVRTGTSREITGLSADTEYMVRVTAMNASGEGLPSGEQTGRPTPGQVAGVRVTPGEGTSLTVEWNAVTGAADYTVEWKEPGEEYDEDGSDSRQTTSVTGTSREITGLSAAIEYTVRVRARNGASGNADKSDGGLGDWSAEKMGRPKPGQVTLTSSSVTAAPEELRVSWGTVIGAEEYTIQWKMSGQEFGSPRQATTSATAYMIQGLTESTDYTVRVFASNPSGDGMVSAEITETAGSVSDHQVTGVKVTSGVGQLTVEWSPVSEATKYTVSLTPEGGSAEEFVRTSTRTVIPNLTSGIVYTVEVTADVPSVDNEPASASVMGTPKPDRVQNVNVVPHAEDPQKLTVSWDAVTGAADTDGYLVQWKSGSQPYDGSEASLRQEAVDASPYPIADLDGIRHTVRVIATNAGGQGPPSADQMATPKPGRVMGVKVTSGVGQLTVKWDKVTGATGYKVQWKSGSGYSDSDTRQVSGLSHTIPGLSADTEYTVQVTARNASGDGMSSDDTGAMAMGTPKPGRVQNVKVVPHADPQKLTVSWETVTGATGYKVQWKSGSEQYSDSATPSRHATAAGLSHTIADLEGIRHTVQVIATNAGGQGPPSADQMGTPKPDKVTGVTVTSGVGQLTVKWAKVAGASSYKVQWKSDGEDYTASRQATPAGLSHTIPGLSADTEYTVQVTARNASGDGMSSDDTGAMAMGTPKPGRVTGVMVTAGPEMLTVKWNSVTGALVVDGYIVQWKSGMEEYNPTNQSKTDRDTRTYDILDLKAGTRYTVRVIATNAADDADSDGTPDDGGDGPASANVSGTPKPAKVTNVATTVPPGVEQLTVTWDRVGEESGREYDVEYKVQWKSGSEEEYTTRRQVRTTGTSTIIRDLTGTTAYTVQVIATNSGGDGPPSDGATGTPTAALAGQVTGVRVTPGEEQLTVEWNRYTGATGGYTVEWKLKSENDSDYGSNNRQATARRTSHVITDLMGGTEYEVRVKVTGLTDPSAFVEATGTPSAATPGRVTEVEVTSSTVTQLTVSWKEILGAAYTVQWKTDMQRYAAARQVPVAAGTMIAMIDVVTNGLKPGTLYMVRVQATNEHATPKGGLWSSEVTGMLKPDSVTLEAADVTGGPEELKVSWDEVPGAASYMVEWRSGPTYPSRNKEAGWTDTEYTIGNLEAGTAYTVRVTPTNRGGDGASSSEQIGTPTPGKVTGVTVTPGSQELMVSWDRIPGAGGYMVQWKSEMEEYSATATPSRQAAVLTGTSHTITGLEADTDYTVQVIATNTNSDDGPPSDDPEDSSDDVTDRPQPGKVMIALVDPGAGQLTVTWGEVMGAERYRVQWRKSEGGRYNSNAQATTVGLRHVIQNLEADTPYSVQVRAINASGEGPVSDPGSKGSPLPVLENQVTNVRVESGTGQLTVSWKAVPSATGYKVEWKSESEGWDTDALDTPPRQATVPGGSRSYVIEKLMGGTEYEVRVMAILPDEDALVEYSDVAVGMPMLDQVQNVVVTSDDVELLRVEWDPVTGDDIEYEVQWKSGSEAYMTAPKTSVTSHTISGLMAGTQYTVRVTATKGAYKGSPSNEVKGTPLADPNQVANVRVASGQGQLTVTWDPLAEATNYKVQWKSGPQDYAANRQMVVETGTRHVITDLTAGTEYSVRVIAVVSGLERPPSGEITGTPTRTPTRPDPRPDPTPPDPRPDPTPDPTPRDPTPDPTPKPPVAVSAAPSMVKHVSVTAREGGLQVRWLSLEKAGYRGPLSGYKVQWKSGSEAYAQAREDTVMGRLTWVNHVIGNLSEKEYTVRVIAFNQHGDGPALRRAHRYSETGQAQRGPDSRCGPGPVGGRRSRGDPGRQRQSGSRKAVAELPLESGFGCFGDVERQHDGQPDVHGLGPGRLRVLAGGPRRGQGFDAGHGGRVGVVGGEDRGHPERGRPRRKRPAAARQPETAAESGSGPGRASGRRPGSDPDPVGYRVRLLPPGCDRRQGRHPERGRRDRSG